MLVLVLVVGRRRGIIVVVMRATEGKRRSCLQRGELAKLMRELLHMPGEHGRRARLCVLERRFRQGRWKGRVLVGSVIGCVIGWRLGFKRVGAFHFR